MADIKLADLFGGVNSMSDQVIKNKNDIVTINGELTGRVKKTGDSMTGGLTLLGGYDNSLILGADKNAYVSFASDNLTFYTKDSAVATAGWKFRVTNSAGQGIRDALNISLAGDLKAVGEIYAKNSSKVYHVNNQQPYLPVNDTRASAWVPNDWTQSTSAAWFSNNGMPTANWYSGFTMKGNTASHVCWQIASSAASSDPDNKIYFRAGKGTAWGTWARVYSTLDKPTARELGVYSREEIDQQFVRSGGTFSDSISVARLDLTSQGSPEWAIESTGDVLEFSNLDNPIMTINKDNSDVTVYGKLNTNGITIGGFGFGVNEKDNSLEVIGANGRVGSIALSPSGSSLTISGNTVIGGDKWLALNPNSDFVNGVYCGAVGALRHDGTIQRGEWGTRGSAIVRHPDSADSVFGYMQPNEKSQHFIIGSYKDAAKARSGIQIDSTDKGAMHLCTNLMSKRVTIVDGGVFAQNSIGTLVRDPYEGQCEAIGNALATISQLSGVIHDGVMGLDPRSIESTVPEATTKMENGDVYAAYGNLVGLLVEGIKELKAELAEVKAHLEL